MFARMSRNVPVPTGSETGGLRHISAGPIMKSQVVTSKIRTEQRTLNPRVRGSRTWRSTRRHMDRPIAGPPKVHPRHIRADLLIPGLRKSAGGIGQREANAR